MLASNGWVKQSAKAMKNGHAEHIHANCDCQYAVRFNGSGGVAGYDPNRYKALYDDAEGDNWEEKLNAMRRDQYAANREKINTQKRAAYEGKTVYERSEDLHGDNESGKLANTEMLSLSSHNMHNSSDILYERSKHVEPISGYDDVFMHGNAWGVSTRNADGEEVSISINEFIQTLKMIDFENGSIRLCVCSAGAEDKGLARLVAQEMGMPVMASTTDIWIGIPDKQGTSKMELFEDNGDGRPDKTKPGHWRIFDPDGSIKDVRE